MRLRSLFGMDLIVKPDDDPVFVGIEPHCIGTDGTRFYVRESTWPVLKEILELPKERNYSQPWTKNRKGDCALCGKALSIYDSKFLCLLNEQIFCSVGFARCDSVEPSAKLFYYYTDG